MADDIVAGLNNVAAYLRKHEPASSDAVLEAADEIKRLRAEVARLGGFLHPIGAIVHPPCSATTRHTVICKCDGRRMLPKRLGAGGSTYPCDCEACEGETRHG